MKAISEGYARVLSQFYFSKFLKVFIELFNYVEIHSTLYHRTYMECSETSKIISLVIICNDAYLPISSVLIASNPNFECTLPILCLEVQQRSTRRPSSILTLRNE